MTRLPTVGGLPTGRQNLLSGCNSTNRPVWPQSGLTTPKRKDKFDGGWDRFTSTANSWLLQLGVDKKRMPNYTTFLPTLNNSCHIFVFSFGLQSKETMICCSEWENFQLDSTQFSWVESQQHYLNQKSSCQTHLLNLMYTMYKVCPRCLIATCRLPEVVYKRELHHHHHLLNLFHPVTHLYWEHTKKSELRSTWVVLAMLPTPNNCCWLMN